MDYEAAEEFRPHIEWDEEILWSGRAVEHPKFRDIGSLGAAWLFFIAWIFIITFCTVMSYEQIGFGLAVLMLAMFNGPVLFFWIPLKLKIKRRYCITNRRLLMMTGKSSLKTYELGILHSVSYKCSNRNVGTVEFSTPYIIRTKKGSHFESDCIIAVEEPDKVFDFMISGGASSIGLDKDKMEL